MGTREAAGDDQRKADGAEELKHGAWNFYRSNHPHVMTDKFVGRLAEVTCHGGFQIVGLDDAVAGEGFNHDLGQLCPVGLHGRAGASDFSAVNGDRDNSDRHHD